jgi:hypothetical protein
MYQTEREAVKFQIFLVRRALAYWQVCVPLGVLTDEQRSDSAEALFLAIRE